MKPYQIHASRWALSSDIKCMLHVFYTAARSLMFPAVYCGLKYLTSSRDLAAIWDISLLIPADCYKQMLNVRLNEDRISVWTIMFSRSDGVSFHIVRSFGDKAGYEAGHVVQDSDTTLLYYGFDSDEQTVGWLNHHYCKLWVCFDRADWAVMVSCSCIKYINAQVFPMRSWKLTQIWFFIKSSLKLYQ